jgi:uncharacterized membrane protein
MNVMASNWLEKVFRFSLLAKGLDGLLELVAGAVLLFTSSVSIQAWVNRLTAHELSEDPTDLVAHALLSLGKQLGAVRLLAALFLLAHGVIKLLLVTFLLNDNVKAYPWAISVLSLFTAYQAYLASQHTTAAMLGLTVLDFLIVVLAVREYLHLRAKH